MGPAMGERMDGARMRATLIGGSAILMWSVIAVLIVATGPLPPFWLNAVAFAIGGGLGLVWVAARGRFGALKQPWRVWLHGVAGLFGFHALYFAALKAAPPVGASLVNYLWPLLIVLFSAALPGERLRPHHVLGAVLGFAGAALAVTGGHDIGVDWRHAMGYAAALGSAAVWAAYSLMSRRLSQVPTEAVAGFCFMTAALSALCHVLFEPPVSSPSAGQWLAVIGIGTLPVGLAFYVWDFGMKRGDVQALGAASYAAPLLSTLWLVAAGAAEPSVTLAAACLLISLGAAIAAKDILAAARRRTAESA
jgi:drug/metabolite transporter (DMT)-like permease